MTFQIQYIDDIQMAFLRMLYNKVTQKFTYFCINGVGYKDSQTDSRDKALDFTGENDYEWEGSSLKEKDIPFDGCQVSRRRQQTLVCPSLLIIWMMDN